MTQMSQFAKSNGKPGNNYDVWVAMQTVERRSLDQPKLHTTVVITIADKLASHGPRLRIERASAAAFGNRLITKSPRLKNNNNVESSRIVTDEVMHEVRVEELACEKETTILRAAGDRFHQLQRLGHDVPHQH